MAAGHFQELLALLQRIPRDYQEWWLRLFEQSKEHVIIETTLIVAILYILLVKKSYDPSKRGSAKEELTEREEEELLQEWQPEPLVPADQGAKSPPYDFVISEFLPDGRQVVVRIAGPDAKPKVTFCTQDFLGNGVAPEVREAAMQTLERYTVGSCGPRGFYGTTKAHLELEDSLAAFMGTPESITYSDSTATTASAIPAFAKRGDVLLVDAGASFAIQIGARLSRSKTVYFRHNDMADLERHLQAVRDRDEAVVDDSLSQRRFIVVEGLYAHYGDLCPLPEVLRLAREYKWRVILDDSCGIGVMGATGRGTIEHYGLSTSDVDVLIGSLATSLASVGGFCVGSREVVDHQRLSGAGYCFSASAPPFSCATATASLQRIIQAPQLLSQLRDRSLYVHQALTARVPGFTVTSDPASPIKHLLLAVGPASNYPRVVTSDMLSSATLASSSLPGRRMPLPTPGPLAPTATALLAVRREEEEILRAIVERAASAGILVTRTHFLETEGTAPRPTLKFYVTLAHADGEIESLLQVLSSAASSILGIKAPVSSPGVKASPANGLAAGMSASSSSGIKLMSPVKSNGKRGVSRSRSSQY